MSITQLNSNDLKLAEYKPEVKLDRIVFIETFDTTRALLTWRNDPDEKESHS